MTNKNTFRNQGADRFGEEIDDANRRAMDRATHGVEGPGTGPFVAVYAEVDGKDDWSPSPRFDEFVKSERWFKWTLNRRGDLGAIANSLKHSVAAGGDDVWTAGRGNYDRKRKRLTLTNETGHYQTTEESLRRARSAWEHLGFEVVFEDREDTRS